VKADALEERDVEDPVKLILRWMKASGALLWPVYWLSGFVRRDPALWVFGSRNGQTFGDNAKWFFFACARDRRVRPVWLTRSGALARELRARGFVAHHTASPRGIVYALRASAYVFDGSAGALNLWFSRGARLVNLWHGVPLKKIEADMPKTSKYYRHFTWWSPRGLFQWIFQPYKMLQHDHIVSTSNPIGRLLASAFRMPADRVLVTGYPRIDPLFDPTLPRAFGETAPSFEGFSRVIGYFPTFREHSRADVAWAWADLNADLKARNALLVIKLHPTDSRKIAAPGLDNIRILPAETDAYPILPRLHALLTDYSSIFFDYLVLDRPVAFFPYDLDEYRNDDRGLYFDYDEVTPGPKATTFEAFRRVLTELVDRYDHIRTEWTPARRKVTTMCHLHQDGGSSGRLIDALLAEGPRYSSPRPL
jgi:CDP-glycerol glycerophosphotransferase (TagB/SpsB family)